MRAGVTTRGAKGTPLKAGAQRRIAVTMDEKLFLDIQALAVDADISISRQIVRYVEQAIYGGAARAPGD